MKLNEKVLKKVWKESIATLVIISAILVISGHSKNIPPTVSAMSHSVAVTETDVLPSQVNEVEITITEKETPNIDQLVADVNSGKAGNGDARKEYLGEYYDEVQTIIDKQYENKKTTVSSRSSGNTYTRATSGSKSEYQNYAYELCISMGWSETDFLNLIDLWERESGWNPDAHNKSSGAHGIPQSLPASKMAAYGDDYYTSGYTQIKWGINYISNRYGNPSKAWEHFLNKNWY